MIIEFEELAGMFKDARERKIDPQVSIAHAMEAIVKKIEELEKDIQVLGNEIRARGNY